MCSGCGACAFVGQDHGVTMVDIPEVGRRPLGVRELPLTVKDQIVSACPGAAVRSPAAGGRAPKDKDELLVGPAVEIWEGWATDPELRRAASSGGVVSALALYCVEQLGMNLVLHTGMNEVTPWKTATVASTDRDGVLANSGSRYTPSSPVEALRLVEESDRPCVFIGKPCDVAAVAELRKTRPALDRNLGLVLSFFCAGTPASIASLNLAKSLGFEDPDEITSVRYRGDGWPGGFRVRDTQGKEEFLTYDDSWGILARRHRQLRCQVCPDGLGELSDITGGDAWHRKAEGSDGVSMVLARTERGQRIVRAAAEAGYLTLTSSNFHRVVLAQGLVRRRTLVAARTSALRVMGIRTPRYPGFWLWRAAALLKPAKFVREFGGTIYRAVSRGYRRPEYTDRSEGRE